MEIFDSTSSRRGFVTRSAAAMAGFYALTSKTRAEAPKLVGHGKYQYEVLKGWGELDPAKYPVANCHEMVEDSKGRLVLFQTNTKNNVLIYDKGGKLIESWGTKYPGAHGLAIVHENGEDFLFLTDTSLGKVYKTKMDGTVLMELGRPDLEQYQKKTPNPKAQTDPKQPKEIQARWAPTNVMPAPDGSFYVGDGYGSSYVMHYSNKGDLIGSFGGPGKNPESLNTPHGGIVDTRNPDKPVLMICSRSDNAVKRFTLAGEYLDAIPIPGMRVCQVARRDGYMVAPHLEGLISVIDENNRVVSNPGGTAPEYGSDGKLGKIAMATDSPFIHPHGVWVDAEHSVYIAQWNSKNTYPVKLKRVQA